MRQIESVRHFLIFKYTVSKDVLYCMKINKPIWLQKKSKRLLFVAKNNNSTICITPLTYKPRKTTFLAEVINC